MTLRHPAYLLAFLVAATPCGCGWFTREPRLPVITAAPSSELPRDAGELLLLADEVMARGASVDELVKAVRALDTIAAGEVTGTSLPEPFEVDQRLARVCYLIAELEPDAGQRSGWLRKGETAAEQARRARPDRVEGPYFLAVLMGRRAEELGLSALGLIRRIEELGLEAMKLDPLFENGGPYRLLAMVYAKAPPWPASIGDTDRALELARQAVAAVDYPLNHFILAEVLMEAGELPAAREQLRAVLSAPKAGKWAQEGETWRPRARKLLDSLSD